MTSLVFPVHTHIGQQVSTDDYRPSSPAFHVAAPMDCMGFISLMKQALFVIIGPGGNQEDPTVLDIPCPTM
jgi:UDP-N-acetylglucosamine 2-epimerase